MAPGTVQCLIDAIHEANANGKKNTIRLEAGIYTLMTPVLEPGNLFPINGLPPITSRLTITGEGAATTIIERDADASVFRILEVTATGTLALHGLTLRGGHAGIRSGGGINNSGTTTITASIIIDNRADAGAGIVNSGTVTVTNSTITANFAGHPGGGLANIGGTMIISNTTVTHNLGDGSGGLDNVSGFVTITNSTFADNLSGSIGGGLSNYSALSTFGGTVILTNSTVARNRSVLFAPPPQLGGGLANFNGTVILLNTILALNTVDSGSPPGRGLGPDCFGVITSQGNNLIGDTTDCTITLRPSDLTGDPGFGAFTDNGTPGHGYFPLLPTSQAIDAGNDAVCPRRDQLGQRRIGACDIGAIAFRDQDDRPHDEEDDHPDEDLAAAAQAAQ